MNKDNAAQFLPMVKALAEGKAIQYRAYSDEKWEDVETPNFYGDPGCYRVKPEPREIVIYRNEFGHIVTDPPIYEQRIRTREILD